MLETASAADSGSISSLPTLQEGVVSVLGYCMVYVTGGAGEPVVFLHRLGQAYSVWDGVLPLLARRFRVFAVDMLGCGASDKPHIDYKPQGSGDLYAPLHGCGGDRARVWWDTRWAEASPCTCFTSILSASIGWRCSPLAGWAARCVRSCV